MNNKPEKLLISEKCMQHEVTAAEIEQSDQPFETTTVGEKLTYALIKVKFSSDEAANASNSDRYAELRDHLSSLKSELGESMHFKMEKLTETCLRRFECAPIDESTTSAV